jgi:signal transduction histidine kinase
LAVLLTLLVLLPIWYFLGSWYQANLIQQERAKAMEQVSARANGLAAAVDQRIALLQGLYAFTRTEWPDTGFDRTFEIYSAGVYFNSTGVRTWMIAPEGIARYIFPLSDSPLLSGYDILNDPDPVIRNDVQRAIRNRGITLGQPGELRQGGFGLIAWQAVYRGKDLWGLVSIALDMGTILKDSGLTDLGGGLDMALRDSVGHTFSGSGEVWRREPVVQTIGLPEGAWELGGAPQEGWVEAVHSQADVFRLNSLVIVGLIAVLVFLTVNRQGQLAKAVAQRTREIAAAQQGLEQRVQERTHELSTVLDVSRRIGSTLALDPLLGLILTEIKPVLDYTSAHIFRLDETGRLIQASAVEGAQPAVGKPASFGLDERLQSQVIQSLQPVIDWDWTADEAYPDKMCWMGVPLVIKDRATGMLAFVHQDPHHYREEDARLALTFAQQVAVAIENARLYEQAGQLAVLEERQRLARELHDSVSQVLYSIGLGVKTARAALEQDPSQISDALDYVNWLAEAGQVEMRSLIFELRPESLRTDGLVAALEKQAAVLHARHKIAVQADFCPEPDVPLAVKEILYRISQEVVHNIVKHAHATQVTLGLECSESQICLEVIDNGIGFDPHSAFPGHIGLKSMRERAVQCQGRIQIDSAPERGTKVQFVIPLQRG